MGEVCLVGTKVGQNVPKKRKKPEISGKISIKLIN